MSFTYAGLPDSTTADGRRDAVRLLVKDTIQSTAQFQDDEIAFFLTENGDNVYFAAADACEQLASGGATSKSVGDLSLSDTATSWLDLARRYRIRGGSSVMPFAGGIRVSNKQDYEADTDRVEPFFTRATGDNEETA